MSSFRLKDLEEESEVPSLANASLNPTINVF
uniref:Gigantea-5 n=1 Tax=Rhizophora mucronata TaxID=61149 RepID=A0A2P2PMF9_RHIMU